MGLKASCVGTDGALKLLLLPLTCCSRYATCAYTKEVDQHYAYTVCTQVATVESDASDDRGIWKHCDISKIDVRLGTKQRTRSRTDFTQFPPRTHLEEKTHANPKNHNWYLSVNYFLAALPVHFGLSKSQCLIFTQFSIKEHLGSTCRPNTFCHISWVLYSFNHFNFSTTSCYCSLF